jgi:hypothetical protein
MSNHTGTTAKLVCSPSCQFVVGRLGGEALYSASTYYLYKIFKMKILSNLITVTSVTKTKEHLLSVNYNILICVD